MTTIATRSTRLPLSAGAPIALLLGLAVLTPAWAAAATVGTDCAPVGVPPGFTPDNPPERHDFAAYPFDTKQGDDNITTEVRGRYCAVDYTFHGKGDPMSALEAQYNFRALFEKLGAQVMYADDSETVAKLTKDGHETWMRASNNGDIYITVDVVEAQPLVVTLKAPDKGDCAPLGRMPDTRPDNPPTTRHFDQATFTVQDGDDSKETKAQGAYCQVSYSAVEGTQQNSMLATQLNYRAALKKAGAQIVYSSESETDARLIEDGQVTWVQVSSNGDAYQTVTVVREKPFQASIKPAQAGELKAALDKDGHVALYINFDFNKASLRPDAAPVIAQVLALLKDNPGLKLSIVGNTDNVGGHDYNVKLSQQRAAAVVAELVKDGVAADRLQSSGDGPDKPIADNDSGEGRARNRRVELVKP